MILLVDAGNSAVKWAGLDGAGTLLPGGRVVHRGGVDVAAALSAAWAEWRPARVLGCAVASREVVDAVERAAGTAGRPVEWMRSQPAFAGNDGHGALVNGYRDPHQLGADRWHALLGACACVPGRSFVVANAGTATTVDCVRVAEGAARFVGGCIAPGVRLMLESLARGTAGLPLATGAPADFPDSTDTAIVTGVLDAQAGLVERVWRRFAASARDPRVLLAGGHAELLAARLPPEIAPVIEHDLVLRGLAVRASTR